MLTTLPVSIPLSSHLSPTLQLLQNNQKIVGGILKPCFVFVSPKHCFLLLAIQEMHYIFAYAPIDVAFLQIDHDRKIFEIWFIGETQNHRCRQSVWLQHWNLYTAIFMLKVLSFPHVSKKIIKIHVQLPSRRSNSIHGQISHLKNGAI